MNHSQARRQMQELNTIYKETDAIYSEFAKRSGMSDCAFWLMYALCEADGKCTQKELCSQWVMSKQTVNSALNGLKKSGYISLILSETDKRSKLIMLTDKGLQFKEKNIDIVFHLEERVLQRLNNTEITAMLESNRKYQELLRAEAKQFLNK
jgi:Transcriptional regulators